MMDFAEIQGLKIRYRLHRKPGAPKLLLTNALPMSIRTWDGLWEKLGQHCEILALDLPGFGWSETKKSLLSPIAMAGFLGKAIEHFSWQGSVAIGPDIGTPVVLALAETRPALLRGIVICDGPGYYKPTLSIDLSLSMTSPWFRAMAKAMYHPRIYLKQVFLRAYCKASPSPEAYQEYLEISSRKESFANTMDFISTYPKDLRVIGEKLVSLRAPTLILWGERDRFVPVKNAEELSRRIPRSQLHVFPGAGHFSHEDAGSAFSEVLLGWQRDLG